VCPHEPLLKLGVPWIKTVAEHRGMKSVKEWKKGVRYEGMREIIDIVISGRSPQL
jgi:hypothetical protein